MWKVICTVGFSWSVCGTHWDCTVVLSDVCRQFWTSLKHQYRGSPQLTKEAKQFHQRLHIPTINPLNILTLALPFRKTATLTFYTRATLASPTAATARQHNTNNSLAIDEYNQHGSRFKMLQSFCQINGSALNYFIGGLRA